MSDHNSPCNELNKTVTELAVLQNVVYKIDNTVAEIAKATQSRLDAQVQEASDLIDIKDPERQEKIEQLHQQAQIGYEKTMQKIKEDLTQKLLPTSETVSESGTNLQTNSSDMANNYQTEKFKDGDIGVIMTTTNGKLEIKLFPKDAPKTVMNFLGLAKKGYYDNLIFHRVIKDFMVQ